MDNSAKSISERLSLLIAAVKCNPNSFSVRIKQLPQTTDKVLKGKNKPGFEYLNAVLSTFSDIDAKWLITGTGDMFATPAENGESRGAIQNHNTLNTLHNMSDNPESNAALHEIIRDLKDEVLFLNKQMIELMQFQIDQLKHQQQNAITFTPKGPAKKGVKGVRSKG